MHNRSARVMKKISIKILPIEPKHLNWVRASFKTSFRKSCPNIIGASYYDAMNPLVDKLVHNHIGYVAVYADDPNEYIGWILCDNGHIIYTFTAKGTNKIPFRRQGICKALMDHANVPYQNAKYFITNDWKEILEAHGVEWWNYTQAKKGQYSEST